MAENKDTVRILIVDDHPSTAATLARAVSQLGPTIDVVSAESGERALTLVQNKTIDLLITDMMMPGMNGLELIEKLQAHPGGRPAYIILITAYDVPGLKETARRLKVNDVIIKPIRPERICQLVTDAIANLGHAAPASHINNTKNQPKILIADDLPDNVALLSRYLQNEGYVCLTAANGVEALSQTRAETPDLVLLDINMPVKDGFETLQEIRTDPAIGHIPVIFLTARLEPMDMQSALNMGADDYITKPFDRRELLARIRTRLRVKEAEDVMRRRNKELNLLPEIGKELSARLDIEELSMIVLRRTVETLGALLGHMVILNPESMVQKTYHFYSSDTVAKNIDLPPLNHLLSQIRETHQGLIIGDTYADSRWQIMPDDPTRSVVVVPMFGRLNLLGVLVLAHEQTGYFSMEQKLLLQAIASQAAIALDNAQLHASLTGSPQKPVSMQPKPIDAALLFDADGRIAWVSPDSEKLFPSPAMKPGEKMLPGKGLDPFIALLEDVIKTRGPQTREIKCLDSRVFSISLNPMEKGGFLALVYAMHQPDPKPVKAANSVVI